MANKHTGEAINTGETRARKFGVSDVLVKLSQAHASPASKTQSVLNTRVLSIPQYKKSWSSQGRTDSDLAHTHLLRNAEGIGDTRGDFLERRDGRACGLVLERNEERFDEQTTLPRVLTRPERHLDRCRDIKNGRYSARALSLWISARPAVRNPCARCSWGGFSSCFMTNLHPNTNCVRCISTTSVLL